MSLIDNLDSDRFQDMAYDILYNIFLFVPGQKAIGALQGTCRRCYQIGSEEDEIWKNQVQGFYPKLLVENDPFFVGYYFKLRNFVSAKKLAALTDLVNTIAHRVDAATEIVVAPAIEILLTTSEINLSKGVCLGPTAALFFRQIEAKRSFSMLDTLNLSGQLLRAEGLEYLAQAAVKKKLPFLKSLSLRQNKLGGSGPNAAEQKRAGLALASLIKACSGSINSLDLSENNIVGEGGLRHLLDPLLLASSTEPTTLTTTPLLPLRLILNKNYLGARGVCYLLNVYSQVLAATQSAVSPGGCLLLPQALSCQNVGLGCNFENLGAKNPREAPRASMDDCLKLFGGINAYIQLVMANAKATAANRLHQREQAKALHEAKRRLGKQGATAESGRLVVQLAAHRGKNLILFETALMLGDAGSADQTCSNALAPSVLQQLRKLFPHIVTAVANFHIATTTRTRQNELTQSFSSGAVLVPQIVDGGARMVVSWPSFDGAETSSSCCIC